ncbi:uncharacterized protein [Spinacia oleracea]|uniref:Uncharacterized protein isoform X2 n=1 Tax=Spinacia oleracea TaxID=3562 RepID=A0ABM3QWQ4_SPIOL|nr:uncharacterized protein LOC130462855 isoform X2 [Spinacia oleracea]
MSRKEELLNHFYRFQINSQKVKGEPNISYICSRYYRPPELIFGATEYSTAIEIWSRICVLAELLLAQPLFPGDSGVDQLVEIIKTCLPTVVPFHKGENPYPKKVRKGNVSSNLLNGAETVINMITDDSGGNGEKQDKTLTLTLLPKARLLMIQVVMVYVD